MITNLIQPKDVPAPDKYFKDGQHEEKHSPAALIGIHASRFNTIDNRVPGPGHYSTNKLIRVSTKCSVIGKQPRFDQFSTIDNPGPGAYRV
jgi:hypothetical protein